MKKNNFVPRCLAAPICNTTVAGWFAQQARIRFLPWDEWRSTVSEKDAKVTWDHIARSPSCSIRKAERLLAYRPRYKSLEAVRESVSWLAANRVIETRFSGTRAGME